MTDDDDDDDVVVVEDIEPLLLWDTFDLLLSMRLEMSSNSTLNFLS